MSEKVTAIIDTNVLLDNPQCLTELKEEYKILIPIEVIEELDNLNHSADCNKRYKARMAIRAIDKETSGEEEDVDILTGGFYKDESKVDNKILSRCISYSKDGKAVDVKLITNDLNLKIKAYALDVDCESYLPLSDTRDYNGWKEVILSDEEMAEFYSKKENIWGLIENEYLIIKNKDGETVDRRRFSNGDFVELKIPGIKGVKPKNDLQICAFDMMNNVNIPIKILVGKPGSGKTFINLKFGINLVEKGKFGKITYIRNPVGKGAQSGFLPGDKVDKLLPFAQGIIDNLDKGYEEFKHLVFSERLEIESPYFMKGASKEDTYFLVDEAEDLDVDIIKLIGTRVAKNSIICFSGDLYQVEKQYKANNGLSKFIEVYKGNPLVGIIKLNEDIRSNVSRLFGDL